MAEPMNEMPVEAPVETPVETGNVVKTLTLEVMDNGSFQVTEEGGEPQAFATIEELTAYLAAGEAPETVEAPVEAESPVDEAPAVGKPKKKMNELEMFGNPDRPPRY